jgi:hypothetical protein
MNDREETIDEAHAKTFAWFLLGAETSSSERHSFPFAAWLQNE